MLRITPPPSQGARAPTRRPGSRVYHLGLPLAAARHSGHTSQEAAAARKETLTGQEELPYTPPHAQDSNRKVRSSVVFLPSQLLMYTSVSCSKGQVAAAHTARLPHGGAVSAGPRPWGVELVFTEPVTIGSVSVYEPASFGTRRRWRTPRRRIVSTPTPTPAARLSGWRWMGCVPVPLTGRPPELAVGRAPWGAPTGLLFSEGVGA